MSEANAASDFDQPVLFPGLERELKQVASAELIAELKRRGDLAGALDHLEDHLIIDEIKDRDLEHHFGGDSDNDEDFEDPSIDYAALEDAKFRIALGDLGEAAIQIARAHPDLARLPDLITRTLNGEA